MRQQVLKALANPPRIFYVPYSLAVLNFVIQFIVFVIIYTTLLFFKIEIQPLFFLLSVIFVHMILAVYSRADPQIGQILSARLSLLRYKIPRRLSV